MLSKFAALIIQVIEVLLRSKAFVVKKIGSGLQPSEESGFTRGQITWSRFSSVGVAWETAKLKANYK